MQIEGNKEDEDTNTNSISIPGNRKEWNEQTFGVPAVT